MEYSRRFSEIQQWIGHADDITILLTGKFKGTLLAYAECSESNCTMVYRPVSVNPLKTRKRKLGALKALVLLNLQANHFRDCQIPECDWGRHVQTEIKKRKRRLLAVLLLYRQDFGAFHHRVYCGCTLQSLGLCYVVEVSFDGQTSHKQLHMAAQLCHVQRLVCVSAAPKLHVFSTSFTC